MLQVGTSAPLGRGAMARAYVAAPFGLSFGVMSPFLLPLRAAELGAPLPLIGAMVGASGLLSAVTSMASGKLSDRLGPRRVHAYAALIAAIATLPCAFTDNYWVLGVLQILAASMASTAWLAMQSYMSSLGAAGGRAALLGKMGFAVNAGMVVAPIVIGASANQFGYQLSFFTLAAMAFAWGALGWWLPDIPLVGGPARAGAAPASALSLLRLKGLQVILMMSSVRTLSAGAWLAFYPLLLVERGFAPIMAGTMISVHALVAMATALAAGPLAVRTGSIAALGLSLAITVLGVALSSPLAVPGLVYVPAILVGVGMGISLPLLIATVSEEVPAQQRGLAIGIRMTANQLGTTISPAALGLLGASVGLGTGFFLIALACWGVIAVAFSMHRRRPKGVATVRR